MTDVKTAARNMVAIAELETAKYNPRSIGSAELDALKASLRAFGMVQELVVNRGLDGKRMRVVGGHQRLRAATELGWSTVPCVFVELDDSHEIALNVALNSSKLQGTWTDSLAGLLESIELPDELMDSLRFDDLLGDLAGASSPAAETKFLAEPDEVPEEQAVPISRRGDVWLLGAHRVMCGDSVAPDEVARLLGDELVALIHADPPYGMGKEAEGIENDNLYAEKLDAFQMSWWRVWRARSLENGSAYLWGNAPDLWRLWYRGGLSADVDVVFRNEIVWDKGTGFGMTSDGAHSFPPATERCLFLMFGQQFLGNQNIADYWDGYEPLRAWLEAERDSLGWTNGDVNRATGTHMAGHWFSKSQFQPISRDHYVKLQAIAAGRAFTEDYSALFERLFPDTKAGGNAHRRELAAQLRETRSYFDNAHDSMTDVWRFPRVHGEERHGHATPKPVAMIVRQLKSSSLEHAIVADPFLGSGSALIAAEQIGRYLRGMEITPAYVDVSVRRWQNYTGKPAHLAGDGRTFEQIAAERSTNETASAQ